MVEYQPQPGSDPWAQQEAVGPSGGGRPETPCPLQGAQRVLMGAAYWPEENDCPSPVSM